MRDVKLEMLKAKMKLFGMKQLAKKAGVSRTSLYNLANGKNFEEDTLSKISHVLNLEIGIESAKPSVEAVSNNLAYYGAPLFYDSAQSVTMDLEETLKWALEFSKVNGLLDSVTPYFLMRNLKSLNRARLLVLLDEVSQLQLLGFYLELIAEYLKNLSVKEFVNFIYQKDFAPLYIGGVSSSKRSVQVLKLKNNPIAFRWNIFTFGTPEDYFARFKKWEKIV